MAVTVSLKNINNIQKRLGIDIPRLTVSDCSFQTDITEALSRDLQTALASLFIDLSTTIHLFQMLPWELREL